MISRLGYDCEANDDRHFSILPSSFLAGTMTLTRGKLSVKLRELLLLLSERIRSSPLSTSNLAL